MQDIWRLDVGWDDPVPTEILKVWEKWISTLHVVEELRIPRYLHIDHDPAKVRFHVFVDASSKGYAAVIYSCYAAAEHEMIVNLVLAKAKVAPLKPQMTIPRMELQAAVLGVRLADCVRKELNTSETGAQFWSDSMTVLRWIKSPKVQFTTFVSNRVAEILHLTSSEQWRHVPTDVNPADVGSRGAMPEEFVVKPTWLTGPEFLRGPEVNWPPDISDFQAQDPDPEIVHKFWVNRTSVVSTVYHRLINETAALTRRTGWLHRYARSVLRSSNKQLNLKLSPSCELSGRELMACELQEASTALVKCAQSDSFSLELNSFKCEGIVARSSPLYKLSPFVDDHGVLRVGGRMQKSDLTDHAKYPIVLHHKHRLTRLIVWHFHLKHHSRVDALLADLRAAGYWPIKGRVTVKKIIDSCFVCRKLFATPCMPFMAPLPRDRVKGFDPPFTCTGLDYFGPITVKIGRKTIKRWVLLLTCMATRAVHLEVVHSMDNSSLLMAIQRFIDRRGKPAMMRSDNGKSFVSSSKVVERTRILGDDRLTRGLTDKGIDCVFNPPHAPHFG